MRKKIPPSILGRRFELPSTLRLPLLTGLNLSSTRTFLYEDFVPITYESVREREVRVPFKRLNKAASLRGVGLNELSGSITRIPQRKTEHVNELYSVFKDWLRVVLDKEVTVNACNPKTMPLVESELIAERAGAHL